MAPHTLTLVLFLFSFTLLHPVAPAPFSKFQNLSRVQPEHRQRGLELRTHTTQSPKSVIVQMFEWAWDSVALECTSFIGPAGYGYVQGVVFDLLFYTRILYLVTNPSEPAPGTRHRRTVVDGLPSRVLHPHFKTRGSHPVPKVRIVTLQFLFKYLPGRLIGTLQYD